MSIIVKSPLRSFIAGIALALYLNRTRKLGESKKSLLRNPKALLQRSKDFFIFSEAKR